MDSSGSSRLLTSDVGGTILQHAIVSCRKLDGAGIGMRLHGPDNAVVRPPGGLQRRSPLHDRFPSWVYPTVLVILLVVGWDVFTTALSVSSSTFPSPGAVGRSISHNVSTLDGATGTTLIEALVGFLIAVGFGVAIAALLVGVKFLDEMLYPLIVVVQSIPRIVLAPFLVLWFGFGSMSKVLLVFLACFFPLVVDSAAGFRASDSNVLRLMESMGASRWQVIRIVRLKKALPHILAGAKVASSLAIIGAIVAEFVGSHAGLGYVLLNADNNFQTSLIFADIVYLSVVTLVFYGVLVVIEHLLVPWHVTQRTPTSGRGRQR